MENKLEPIVKALQEKFKATYEEFRGEVHVFVTTEQIIEALTFLRDKYEFELLSALTAVGLLAADIAALPRHLSTDVAGEKCHSAVESPGGWRPAQGPDRDACV